MDKSKAAKIRKAAELALAPLAEEHGLQITIKGGTYDDGQITFKVEFAELDDSGTAMTKEADDFKHYCHRYGMAESDLGREFESRGETYTIKGCKPRSRNAILAKRNSDGKGFKFDPDIIKRAWSVVPS